MLLALLLGLATGQVTTNNCKPGSVCVAKQFRSTNTINGGGAYCHSGTAGPAWAWGLDTAAGLFALLWDSGSAGCPRAGFGTQLMTFNSSTTLTTIAYATALTAGSLQFNTTSAPATPSARSATSGRLQTEAVFQNLYYRDATVAQSHSFIVGGGQHPTQQVFTAAGRVGAESTVCPVITSPVPQTGGSGGSAISHTCTTVAAATSSVGAATGRSYRVSTTLGVANSTDTVVTQAFVQPRQAPRFCAWVLSPSTLTTVRLWVGLFSAAPGSSDGPTASHLSFRFSTNAGDTNWMICSADGTTSSCSSTGLAVVASREYLLCLDATSSSAIYAQVSGEGSGPVFATKSTNLPQVNSNLLMAHSVETLAASARGFGLSSWSAEQR